MVANRRLERRRVDGLGQAVTVAQTGRQGHTAHGLRLLVFGPTAARQVAANDTLNGEHVEVRHQHGTFDNVRRDARRR